MLNDNDVPGYSILDRTRMGIRRLVAAAWIIGMSVPAVAAAVVEVADGSPATGARASRPSGVYIEVHEGDTSAWDGRTDTRRSALAADVRAIWVVRTSLTDTLPPERIAQEAARLGANTLFVQISGRGDAWYASDMLPRAESLAPGSGDQFAPLLEEAHRLGISVHAWINVGLVWSAPGMPIDPAHVVNRHPEWIQRFPDGRSMADVPRSALQDLWVEGIFAEVASPGYRRHVAGVVREILKRYPVDGVHLDYIRRPIIDTGYDESTLRRFEEDTGYGAAAVRPVLDGSPGLEAFRWPDYGDSVATASQLAWNRFRRQAVTAAVWNVRRVVDEVAESSDREIVLSAAVIPDPGRARKRFAQDWPSWVSDGLIDYVVPMCYRAGRHEAEAQLVTVLGAVGPEKVIAGVGAYQQPVGEAALSLRRMLRHPVRGVSIFSYGSLEERGFDGWHLVQRAWVVPVGGRGSADSG